MNGPWGGSVAFLLYVLVTRSTSGCFRVISSMKDCQNTEATRECEQFRDGFGLQPLLLWILPGRAEPTENTGVLRDVGSQSGNCTALTRVCKHLISSPGLALLLSGSLGCARCYFNSDLNRIQCLPHSTAGIKPYLPSPRACDAPHGTEKQTCFSTRCTWCSVMRALT